MGMGLSMQLSIRNELAQRMRELPDKGAVGVTVGVERAAQRTAQVMKNYAKGGHPEFPNVVHGNLSNRIDIQPITTGVHSETVVYVEMEYGPYVEFGHMQTMAWGHLMEQPKWTPAYPFARPAMFYMEASGEAQALLVNAIQEEILYA